jgi:SAM-dependent methyltransferase/uncharacterized protein YbaR (Trm112 family)
MGLTKSKEADCSALDPQLIELLVCPRDRTPLRQLATTLVCEQGHNYGVVEGIPILLVSEVAQTHVEGERSLAAAAGASPILPGAPLPELNGIDPWVNHAIAATNGILYLPLVGKLQEYPIPLLRLPPGNGRLFLEIGSNWGRWCIAAARAGYRPVGIDPSLNGVRSARQVARQLGVDALYVVAEGRFLPFRDHSFAQVFSYSTLQHLAKADTRRVLGEIGRVLMPGGASLVQMANVFGIRCLYHQARRGFRETRNFEVRYWRPRELQRAFEDAIGPAVVQADGYFSLNPQISDVRFLLPHYRAIVYASHALYRLSQVFPPLKYVADSLYVTAHKPDRKPSD